MKMKEKILKSFSEIIKQDFKENLINITGRSFLDENPFRLKLLSERFEDLLFNPEGISQTPILDYIYSGIFRPYLIAKNWEFYGGTARDLFKNSRAKFSLKQVTFKLSSAYDLISEDNPNYYGLSYYSPEILESFYITFKDLENLNKPKSNLVYFRKGNPKHR